MTSSMTVEQLMLTFDLVASEANQRVIEWQSRQDAASFRRVAFAVGKLTGVFQVINECTDVPVLLLSKMNAISMQWEEMI